jgi:hypothetical protein
MESIIMLSIENGDLKCKRNSINYLEVQKKII